MISIKKAIFYAVCLLFTANNAAISQYAMYFLLEPPEARYSGMGSAGTAIANDVYAVYFNPAGLGFLGKSKISEKKSVNYFEIAESFNSRQNPDIKDMFMINSAGAYNFGKFGTLALDFTYFNIGEFTRTAENGLVLGKFNASEFSIGLSFGKSVSNELSLGAKLKYMQSNIGQLNYSNLDLTTTGSSVAFDLALLWVPEFVDIEILDKRFFSIGLNLQNIGPKVSFDMESEPLPTNLRLGLGIKALNHQNHKVNISFDIQKLLVVRDSLGSDPLPKSLITAWTNESGFVYSFGTEYWLKRFFAVRSGVFYEPVSAGNRQFFTFGISGRFYLLQGDIAYLFPLNEIDTRYDRAKLTLRFGL